MKSQKNCCTNESTINGLEPKLTQNVIENIQYKIDIKCTIILNFDS